MLLLDPVHLGQTHPLDKAWVAQRGGLLYVKVETLPSLWNTFEERKNDPPTQGRVPSVLLELRVRAGDCLRDSDTGSGGS